MNVTVYLGSSIGSNPAYAQAATELGSWIGSNGHQLIYGGSSVGLMGTIADAVLDAGGTVIGIEPRFLMETEVQHEGITELIPVDTMTQRKSLMIEYGDVFVALPGGVGTLEEISEIASRIRLGLTDTICVFFNVNGYYAELRAYLQRMEREGFIEPHQAAKIVFCDTLEEVTAALQSAPSL